VCCCEHSGGNVGDEVNVSAGAGRDGTNPTNVAAHTATPNKQQGTKAGAANHHSREDLFPKRETHEGGLHSPTTRRKRAREGVDVCPYSCS
jgi:hypothetical protein